ncbi:hypothetical protein GF380_06350, partial [Candidatus Uhrbacteria bacterium]|nr:hypothetical protein [Candidatus Uhrbacteria bacterium]MBD3284573.1 hypothetical protein [Candidatus Uhrbacteria bacterium]
MFKNIIIPHLTFERIKSIVSLGALVAIVLVSMPLQIVDVDAAASEDTQDVLPGNLEEGELPKYWFEITPYTDVTVVRTYHYVPMTAYTSRPEETDDTPFITADGSHVRDGIVAANFLPFGTKVRIPSLFGDQIFEVHD